MIAGKNDQMRPGKLRRQRLLDAADLQRQRFDPTERAERLGLVVDALVQRVVERAIERRNVELHRQVA